MTNAYSRSLLFALAAGYKGNNEPARWRGGVDKRRYRAIHIYICTHIDGTRTIEIAVFQYRETR